MRPRRPCERSRRSRLWARHRLEVIDHLDAAPQYLGPPPTLPPLIDWAPVPGASKGVFGQEDAIDQKPVDGRGAAETSAFVHDLINLLGVILTYCDLLTSSETQPLKVSYLEQLGIATESAVEMTRELFPARVE